MIEKPDYVKNFMRPADTEIKYIRGHWYLYERSNVYDPQIGRSGKKSGKILGSITEQGLIPSRARRECVNPVLNDVVEVGAVNYIYPGLSFMPTSITEFLNTLGRMRGAGSCRYPTLQTTALS